MKEVESAFFRTVMGISGRDLAGISSLSHFTKTEELRDSTFLKNGGVTYVTDYGVTEHLPDLGHWGLDSDLSFKGLRN
jgi:hypothetical protein